MDEVNMGPGGKRRQRREREPRHTNSTSRLVIRVPAWIQPFAIAEYEDDEGIVLDSRSARGARLIYVTPGHQFPLGITMSLPRRLHLLELAEKSDALIFEDDYDSEYRYSGRPMPALQGLDRVGRVLYAGTFSKTLFPSLRLGYLVVPPDLVSVFQSAKAVTKRHTHHCLIK